MNICDMNVADKKCDIVAFCLLWCRSQLLLELVGNWAMFGWRWIQSNLIMECSRMSYYCL